jgi:hypothetical protein
LIHAYFFSSLTNANWGGIIRTSKWCGETIHGAFLSSSSFHVFFFFSLFFTNFTF